MTTIDFGEIEYEAKLLNIGKVRSFAKCTK